MNSKVTTNSQLSTMESKKKKQKQTGQATRTEAVIEMEITWRVVSGEGGEGE